MINILIPDELAEEIINLAQREATSVTDVLTRMVRQYTPPEPVNDAQVEASESEVPPLGTGARLAYEADQWGFASGLTDSVERSREILETEFAQVTDAEVEATLAMIGMSDYGVMDMSTTVRETMDKFWRDKNDNSD